MSRIAFFAAGLASIALAGAAQAADLIVEAPAVVAPVATDWSGFYIGGHAGYGAGTLTLDAPFIDEDDAEEDITGFFGGVQAGYNWQLDSIVLGIDSSLSLSGLAYDEDGDGENDTVDWFGSTTARVGVALDTVLPYVKAGVAYAGGTGWAEGEDVSATYTGWTAGLGIEFKLADNISLFGEYDYYSFDSKTLEFEVGDVDVSPEFSTARIGVNFKF